jgi:hypothetical protein
MLAYDERVDWSKRFVNRRWYVADGEWRRAPIAGHWATIKPLGRRTFEIVVERDDELHCRTVVRRRCRCESLMDAKELAWECLEPRLQAVTERPKLAKRFSRN